MAPVGGVNRRQKDHQQNKRPSRTSSRRHPNTGKWLNWRCILTTSTTLTVPAILGILYYSQTRAPATREITLTDNILHAVGACEEFITQVYEIDAFLMGKNIAEYMKVRLRPIQERISSLRTQIHQYEDMDRIQGGPSHFMATTLKELEKLENELTDVDLEVERISDEDSRKSVALHKRLTEAVEKNADFISEESVQLLGMWGIQIGPPKTVEPKDVHKIAHGRTLEEILRLYERLARLFNKSMDSTDKVNEKLEELGLPMMPTDGSLRTFDPNEMPEDLMALVEDMSIIREKLNAEIRRNRELYALYLPLKSVVIQQLSEALEKVLAYENDKVLPFKQLKDTIIEETRILKIRVANLGLKYPRKTSEL